MRPPGATAAWAGGLLPSLAVAVPVAVPPVGGRITRRHGPMSGPAATVGPPSLTLSFHNCPRGKLADLLLLIDRGPGRGWLLYASNLHSNFQCGSLTDRVEAVMALEALLRLIRSFLHLAPSPLPPPPPFHHFNTLQMILQW